MRKAVKDVETVRMTGACALVASLEAEGVQLIFGYPGSQAALLYDALYDSKQVRHVLARHEQAAVHEADGYARATGKVGVAMVTSGPGATNAVTGIATAYMDSVPLVVVSGQVPRGVIGTDAFQESDIVGITMPVVKHSYLVQSADEIPTVVREAFHIARTGRPGPVLIDIPSDVAADRLDFAYPETVDLPGYKPTYKGNARQVKQAVAALEEADRPVLYVGGGSVISGAGAAIAALSQQMGIPCVTTLMGKTALPADLPLNLGAVGLHGSLFANKTLQNADLIIACGARFSDRVTGAIGKFNPGAKLVHIDIDPAEIGKVRAVQVPIVGDLRGIVESMCERLENDGAAPRTQAWVEQVGEWRERYPLYDEATVPAGDDIVPEQLMRTLSARLDPAHSIVSTEVGQHQMWAAQHIDRTRPRTFLASGGLGTMGFGFPAAIGAALGCPDDQVVCIAGDGSFQMNEQEMATAAVNGAPVKVVVMDNRALGMVRQWQGFFCEGRYSQTNLAALPDFVMLARSYGWPAQRIEHRSEVEGAIEWLLAQEGPALLDVALQRECNVFPMMEPGGGLEDMLGVIDRQAGPARVVLPDYLTEADTDKGAGR